MSTPLFGDRPRRVAHVFHVLYTLGPVGAGEFLREEGGGVQDAAAASSRGVIGAARPVVTNNGLREPLETFFQKG